MFSIPLAFFFQEASATDSVSASCPSVYVSARSSLTNVPKFFEKMAHIIVQKNGSGSIENG